MTKFDHDGNGVYPSSMRRAVIRSRCTTMSSTIASIAGAWASAPSAAAPAPVPTVDRSALEKLLPALWQAAGRDEAVFTTMFQGNPALVAAFTLDDL